MNAVAQTLKYRYDGQEVIAETDESNVMQRRYIHGMRRIYEQAIMSRAAHVSKRVLSSRRNPLPYGLGWASASLNTYYYLVRELSKVAESIKRNGTLFSESQA